MKPRIAALVLVMGLIGAILSDSALADRGRHHHHPRARFGVVIGAPLFWPWYYPSPYYYPHYYPPAVVVPSPPPTYVERGDEEDDNAAPSSYWYYCSSPDGYYPYVKDCPGGWQRVAPRPSASR